MSFFPVKPRIDRTNLKNIVVRAGKTIKYDVNIRGEPPPTVTWFLADKEVSKTGFIVGLFLENFMDGKNVCATVYCN